MPSVFIGSSKEARSLARALQLRLSSVLPTAEVKHWEDYFRPGYAFLESLVAATKEFDFAVILLTPDDVVKTRDTDMPAPRDNLLFEAGLFVGALGRERTFVVVDEKSGLRLPTDLGGIKHLGYESATPSALGEHLLQPALEIAHLIEQLGAICRMEPSRRAERPRPDEQISREVQQHQDVYGARADTPNVNVWYENIRPQLHHAANYGCPTYFLDVDLHVVDWNVSFQTLFRPILSEIYYKHVNHFIAALTNAEEVFRHARDFTRRVEETHELPLVDTEPITFHSDRYGDVSLLKFACKLHDPDGNYRGWAVRLDVRDINWILYTRDLEDALRQAALWNLYAAAYDSILMHYPEYLKLLDVAANELGEACCDRLAVDIGCGTGNMSALLARRGFTVAAVEDSLGMLDRLQKRPDADRLTIFKGSADNLRTLTERHKGRASAVTMINVLYAVEDPVACLDSVFQLLEPGGRLVLTTTHRESDLDKLLDDIAQCVKRREDTEGIDLGSDLRILFDANREIRRTIARRHTREEYLGWVETLGFRVRRYEPSVYCDALLLIAAEKPSSRRTESPVSSAVRSYLPGTVG
jgi:2-polyprenyl-3-methyl-5-hydroxy-6-metoxy-1,4-benzoquinol methylase